MDNFIDAVLTGREPITFGTSARTTIELINGIVLSGIRKEVVTFPLDRTEHDDVFEALKREKEKVSRL